MSNEVLFETERLLLTNWTPAQLPDLMRLHGDPETARYLSTAGAPWTEAQAAERLAEWIENYRTERMGKLRLLRRSDGLFIGRAGFGLGGPPRGVAEIGYALLPEHRGQGYATEAASGLRDWLFRETERDHFIGFADARNTASLAVLRRIGMKDTHAEDYEGMICQFTIMRRAEWQAS